MAGVGPACDLQPPAATVAAAAITATQSQTVPAATTAATHPVSAAAQPLSANAAATAQQALTGGDAVAVWANVRKLPGTLKTKLDCFCQALQQKHPQLIVPPVELRHLTTVSTPCRLGIPSLFLHLICRVAPAARVAVETKEDEWMQGTSRQEQLLQSAMAADPARKPVAKGHTPA